MVRAQTFMSIDAATEKSRWSTSIQHCTAVQLVGMEHVIISGKLAKLETDRGHSEIRFYSQIEW